MPKSNKPGEITVRFTRLIAVLLFVAALCASSLAADKAPAPGAATILAGTPEQYLSACHADMDRARSQMAALKAMKAPRDPIPALDAYDEAELALANALFRSGLAREVEPAAEMRAAAEKCEQEADALSTDFSLDRGIYDALAGLDRSKLDAETKFYLERSLRDFRRAGVDRDDATRARIKDLREQLVKTGQQFGNNLQVKRCEEPRAVKANEPPAEPATEIGDWQDWPFSLMDYLPSAERAAGGRPHLVIWHFQLPAG